MKRQIECARGSEIAGANAVGQRERVAANKIIASGESEGLEVQAGEVIGNSEACGICRENQVVSIDWHNSAKPIARAVPIAASVSGPGFGCGEGGPRKSKQYKAEKANHSTTI